MSWSFEPDFAAYYVDSNTIYMGLSIFIVSV